MLDLDDRSPHSSFSMSMSITIPRNTVKVEIAIQVVLSPSHLRTAIPDICLFLAPSGALIAIPTYY